MTKILVLSQDSYCNNIDSITYGHRIGNHHRLYVLHVHRLKSSLCNVSKIQLHFRVQLHVLIKSFVEFAKNIMELQVRKVKTTSGSQIVRIKPTMVVFNPVSIGYTIYGNTTSQSVVVSFANAHSMPIFKAKVLSY